MAEKSDVLDKTVRFLQKRDGTDKLLKILRYSVKLLLASQALTSAPEATKRLKSFEASVGVSRKALRIGKFLQDLDELRKAPPLGTTEGILELISSGGEGIYYFVEQLIWLVKAGAIDKRHGPRLQKISAFFELVGYTGSITLKAMQVAALFQKESVLVKALSRQKLELAAASSENHAGTHTLCASNGPAESEGNASVTNHLVASKEAVALRMVRFKRTLKLLSLIQDLSDSLLALADVMDEDRQPQFLRNAGFLAAAGLLSAAISAHKNWVA